MKKAVLVFSLLGIITLYVLFNTRDIGLCETNCSSLIGQYQNVFLFFPILLFFSITSFKMKEVVFASWWRFARITTPVILAVSIVINAGFHHNSYGLFNMDDMFDMPALLLMYLIFIVGSIVQIWRGYTVK